MKKTTKRLSLAVAAATVAGLTFAAGSAFADHHEKDKGSTSMDKSGEKDIVATAKAAGQFNTLASALKQAELVSALQAEGPFTVFAPTDEAFNALPSGTVETLMQPEAKGQLQQILLYHVVSGENMASDVTGLDEVETLQGEAITISTEGGKVMLNGITEVTKTDIKASNGVIHVIDGVLIPTGGQADDMEDMDDDMDDEPSM